MKTIHHAEIEGRPWLTVNQAMWLMNIGRSRLYALIASNDIRAIKDGGKRLIDRQSLDDYRNRLAG